MSEIQLSYATYFKASYKKLSSKRKEEVQKTINKIISYKKTRRAPYGLRIKQLRSKIYEARIGIDTRIVFFSDKNSVRFIALGNHDHILRVLKQIDKLK